MNKWLIKGRKGNTVNIETLSKATGIGIVATKLLANRGIADTKEALDFINPVMDNLHNTLNMKDMDKGISLIVENINDKKKIAIYGDYDADGIMSTVILYKAFKRCGADVIYYIPDRESEGYGVNMESVYKLHDLGIDTIFTCDNGISAIEEIAEAKKFGMNIIILDHHEVKCDSDGKQILPIADAIIDPKRKDCSYPFEKMCAAGIAYKFTIELYKLVGIPLEEAEKFIIYATLATICDIVDLIDENRIIVKKGLVLLNQTDDIGLKALIQETLLNDKFIGVYQVGFILGPCINATGRLEQATTAVKLFTTESLDETKELATKLVSLNNARKSMTLEAVERALKLVEESDLRNNKVLVIYDENIHESIAGIVAGKIKENYYLPTIMLTKGENMAKGSARSIEEYNIFEELCKCSELLDRFGGHPMAAGMSLKYENIEPLRERLNSLCMLTEEDILPKIRIDVQLPLEYISFKLVKEIDTLAPFGRGNETPLFAQKNIKILKIDFIGQKKNILRFQCDVLNNKPITAISFDGYDNFKKEIITNYDEETFDSILAGKKIELNLDMVYTININEYNGSTTLQIIIKDLRISKL